jgi:hypothetical protein
MRISSYIRKHFLIYDCATAPLLYIREKILFNFLSLQRIYVEKEEAFLFTYVVVA